jgi:polyisoprenoid-binding protein YceI
MRLGLATMAVAAWVAPAPAHAAGWQVDPARSSIKVEIDQTGKPLAARFESFAAEITFDPKNLAKAAVVVTVDLASFRSGDAQRDQMAISNELLAASSGPTARYESRKFTARGGDRYDVEAELTLKGVSRPLSHTATIAITGDEARAQGQVVLTRTDFGVGANQFPRGDQIGLAVTVRFDLVAHRRG